MTWAKIDDKLHSHPKVMQAWCANRASLGLHLLSLSYASAYSTDGFITEGFVAMVLRPAERRRAVTALIDAGIWDAAEGGWQIHDYLEYNPSAAELKVKRDWDVARKGLERDRPLVAAIKARDADRCRYCGEKVNWRDRKGPKGGSYDHVMPRGPNTLENVVVACRDCNGRKRDRTPEQAGMPLLDPPNEPRNLHAI